MKQDRVLSIIGVFLVVLVIASIALFFYKQSSSDYGPDDSPDGVVRNYIIALQRSDYTRAYSYLAEDEDKPTYEDFRDYIIYWAYGLENVGVQILDTRVSRGEAIVDLSLLHGGGGLMRDIWRQGGSAILIDQDGQWRLIKMPTPFFQWEWFGNDNYPGYPPASNPMGLEV